MLRYLLVAILLAAHPISAQDPLAFTALAVENGVLFTFDSARVRPSRNPIRDHRNLNTYQLRNPRDPNVASQLLRIAHGFLAQSDTGRAVRTYWNVVRASHLAVGDPRELARLRLQSYRQLMRIQSARSLEKQSALLGLAISISTAFVAADSTMAISRKWTSAREELKKLRAAEGRAAIVSMVSSAAGASGGRDAQVVSALLAAQFGGRQQVDSVLAASEARRASFVASASEAIALDGSDSVGVEATSFLASELVAASAVLSVEDLVATHDSFCSETGVAFCAEVSQRILGAGDEDSRLRVFASSLLAIERFVNSTERAGRAVPWAVARW